MSSNDLILESSNGVASAGAAVGYRPAYDRSVPDMMRLDETKLLSITLDLPSVVVQTGTRMPRLMAMRPLVATAMPQQDLTCFDKLPDCLGALAHAHASAISPPKAPQEDLVALGAQVFTRRARLIDEASHLARYGMVDGKRLEPIKGLSGYKNVSFETIAVVGILRESWPQIAGKTMVTSQELDQDEAQAKHLLDAVSERDRLVATQAEAQVMRQRAFTLFVQTYDQVRRAVTYLLWDDPEQLEAVCPSLYSGQRGKRSDKDAGSTPDAKATPVDSVPNSTMSSAHTPSKPVIPGQPGGSPFIS